MSCSCLHITNGDSTVSIMKQAGIEGEYLPWRDVLHDGPVPGNLSLTELSTVRSEFIVENGWGERAKIEQGFRERDDTLARFRDFAEVVLWFEHDLYDQLQLLQLLDWFSDQSFGGTKVSLICIDRYLGLLSPEEMASLSGKQTPVTKGQMALAKRAWYGFCSESHADWRNLLFEDTSGLPYLGGAVRRLLQEYPSIETGLPRTEHQALQTVDEEKISPAKLFGACQRFEERIYMGDWSFWDRLNHMIHCESPLLCLTGGEKIETKTAKFQELEITKMGCAVLSGEKKWYESAVFDRWIGGVHLAPRNAWCWEDKAQQLVRH